MKNIKLLFASFMGIVALTTSAFADNEFNQDGHTYVVKSGLVGVPQLPNEQTRQSNQESQSKKMKSFFKVYDAQDLKLHGAKLSEKQKFQVVHKLVKNPHTQEIKEVPALLSGQVIVKANSDKPIKTSLKLKKHLQNSDYFIYELANTDAIADVLSEFKSQPHVQSAKIEIIEHLRVLH